MTEETEKILKFLKSGMFEEAIAALDHAIDTYPESVELRYLYAGVMFQLGRMQEAEDSLKKIAQLNPAFTQALTLLAQIYFETGRYSKAVQIFMNDLRTSPTDVNTLISMGNLCYQGNDIESARLMYELALKVDPLNNIAIQNLATIHGTSSFRAGQRQVPVQGTVSIGESTPLSNTQALKRYEEAVSLIENGQLESAQNIFVELLLNPSVSFSLRSAVYTGLGLIAYEQGELEKAEQLITTAIFTDPLAIDAYKKLILINKMKIQKQYKFSMIIPTYNRCSELKRCIESIHKNSFFPVEIIVVCDPCADGSIEYLEKEKSKGDLIAIINENRIGMPKSANRGFMLATGDYIGYINDDAEIMPGWDLSIVVTIDNDPSAGCAAPLVIFPDGRVQSPGQYNPYKSTVYGFIGKTPFIDSSCVVGKHIKNFPDFHSPRECDYGYFPVMKRACFDKAGFFDEQYAHYFIDPDLGYKIQKAGYKNIYCPTSVFVHHELSKKDPAVLQKRFMADFPKFFKKWGLV